MCFQPEVLCVRNTKSERPETARHQQTPRPHRQGPALQSAMGRPTRVRSAFGQPRARSAPGTVSRSLERPAQAPGLARPSPSQGGLACGPRQKKTLKAELPPPGFAARLTPPAPRSRRQGAARSRQRGPAAPARAYLVPSSGVGGGLLPPLAGAPSRRLRGGSERAPRKMAGPGGRGSPALLARPRHTELLHGMVRDR